MNYESLVTDCCHSSINEQNILECKVNNNNYLIIDSSASRFGAQLRTNYGWIQVNVEK